MRRLLSVAPVLLWLVTPLAFAQLPGITSQPSGGGCAKLVAWCDAGVHHLVDAETWHFNTMTSFTRIIIVLVYVRAGTPLRQFDQVLLGLALFLTFLLCHH